MSGLQAAVCGAELSATPFMGGQRGSDVRRHAVPVCCVLHVHALAHGLHAVFLLMPGVGEAACPGVTLCCTLHHAQLPGRPSVCIT